MNGIEIYKVGGVLDTSTSSNEQEKIMKLLKIHLHIGLDLSQCQYVSSAGLRVMLYAYKIALGKGGRVDLIGVSEEIREVMDMTGFSQFFKIYRTVEECISQ